MEASVPEQRRPPVAAALRETRKAFVGVAVLSAVTNLLMLTGPLFMMQIYDRVLASRSVPTLVALSVLVLGLYLALGLLEVIRARILTEIGQRLDERLGGPTFDSVLRLPLRMSKKEAIAQPIRDLDQLRQFMGGQGPIAICDMPWLPFYLAILFLFHVWLGWLAVAGVAVLVALTLAMEASLRRPMRRLARIGSKRAEFVEAGRRNAEALHAMGMSGAYATRWNDVNGDYVEEQRRTSQSAGVYAVASKIFRLALQSAVLALGAWLAINQRISPGAMIAASILTSRALAPVEMAVAHWRAFVNARQARGRLESLLGEFAGFASPMPLPAPKQTLEVTGLAVAAPGNSAAIVRDVTFRLAAGQGLGIIGPSGSGKSTLARALVGVWPPSRGTIRLDGAELGHWDPGTLGSSVGYLPQDIELFRGTIAENISRFRPNAEPATIIEAAERAGVHRMILAMREGYDTQIGTGGAILSAGQRQRVGLARALYGGPFLLVLDEPNANLDSDGEAALTNAVLSARRAGAIVVVNAHRPNALAAVDQVLVMTEGTAVAFGPRDEVLRKATVRAVAEQA